MMLLHRGDGADTGHDQCRQHQQRRQAGGGLTESKQQRL